jgi:ribose 5-phosphate isomerase B
LKEHLRRKLEENGHQVEDYGTNSADSCDYPDYALPVAQRVAQGSVDRGVLVCSTGIGMAMAANKIDGVRAAPVSNIEEARLTREHNDANILTIGAKFIGDTLADELVEEFLKTEFTGGRHSRRVAKIARMERIAANES